MINKFELARKAKEYGLQSSTIEKDYRFRMDTDWHSKSSSDERFMGF